MTSGQFDHQPLTPDSSESHPPVLAGSLVVVTGGGSGIGAAVTAKLISAGAEVLVVDTARSDDNAASAVVGDVSDVATWRTVADHVDRSPYPLRGAVLNAGLAGGGGPLDLDPDRVSRLVGANLYGVLFGIRYLASRMADAGGGSIVATASVGGLIPIPFDPVYAATKHAVVGYVRSAAAILAGLSIRLQAVCPGLADTPLLGAARADLEAVGYPLLAPDTVADVICHCLEAVIEGEVIVVQAGRPAEAYQFRGVPGPRNPYRAPLPGNITLGRKLDF